MHVQAVRFEIRFPSSQSLKDKRRLLRPVIDGARSRYSVAVAEVDHQDSWQRSAIGICAVSESARHTQDVVDQVERFIWSFPELEVLDAPRYWLET